LRGAFLAAAVILAMAAARHQLDGWLVGAAVFALVVSAALPPERPRRLPPEPATVPRQEPGSAEALLANIPDPVILVDGRAVVLAANEPAMALLPGLQLKHPLSFALRHPDVLEAIDAVLRTGLIRKVQYVERVPTERAFEVQLGPLKTQEDPAAVRPGVARLLRDQTSARRREQIRVDLGANASHELRTPLASLLGFIETLQGPARNDAAARERFLEIMRGQAQRMKRLIDDLLSLSRIEMRAHLAPEDRLDLTALVRHMVDLLSPLARERKVEVRLTVPDVPLYIRGDRDELLRVIENLVENAVKYGESPRGVDVMLRAMGQEGSARERIELTVRDYGPGIPPEHLPRLTERFYRVDAVQSREKGGTGLGLAIVKHIVNRHRGELTIESEPGAGALFRITLPMVRDAEPKEEEAAGSA
jgi:two-component system phosphate regulon sensor histidine kinase PhoR